MFSSVPILNLRYSFHMYRVNLYVIFQSVHISNLGHNHVNLLRLLPLVIFIYMISMYRQSQNTSLLMKSQTMYILTISTGVSPFLHILCLYHHFISFPNIDTTHTIHKHSFNLIQIHSIHTLMKQVITIYIKKVQTNFPFLNSHRAPKIQGSQRQLNLHHRILSPIITHHQNHELTKTNIDDRTLHVITI